MCLDHFQNHKKSGYEECNTWFTHMQWICGCAVIKKWILLTDAAVETMQLRKHYGF